MQFPDAARVLGQTANPAEQQASIHNRARETFSENQRHLVTRERNRRPTPGLVESLDKKRRSAPAGVDVVIAASPSG